MLSAAQDTNRRRVHMHPTATTGISLNSQHTPISRCNPMSNMPYQRQQGATEQAMRAPNQDLQHIWIITGPAGCGKTTVAKSLSKKLQVEYIEGDDYHPESNKQKMRNNIPLDDGDRWDWLIALRDAAIESLQTRSAVVVTCSALKKKYRDVIRVAAYNHPMVQIHFIYLDAEEDVLVQRVTARKGHYMPPTMVHSQFQALEKPVPGSEGDAITVSCDAKPSVVQDRVNREVNRIMEQRTK
ncbi:thermoresistant gluconokinase [Blastomyces dermatitidis ER-3]|uniref:Gluconokinase n=1 Tax=Ajellomyces dermatitidis (strain ER-3 / ATCC MYA-2586) TaxID=559297 RepID=A0ABP2F182_AJEDR|nr:thermoresistant gluconokinase [Blastomyces dermatitidis ER-3]EEQ90467.1 thermoresistant gluconokinase [Blastomyces dermatitidis ER-3]